MADEGRGHFRGGGCEASDRRGFDEQRRWIGGSLLGVVRRCRDEDDAVTELSACRGQDFGEFVRSGDAHGVWEVFYAPHIHALSSAVRTQIRPLQYILTDSGFTSNVRYLRPVGDGWLSAAGDYVEMGDGQTVEILFDSFGADAGRDNWQPEPRGEGMLQRTLINVAGKRAFISALSEYPVYYADADITVFEFTAPGTRIALGKSEARSPTRSTVMIQLE